MKRNNVYHIHSLVPGSKLKAPTHLKPVPKTSKGSILFALFFIAGVAYFVHGIMFPRDYSPITSFIEAHKGKLK